MRRITGELSMSITCYPHLLQGDHWVLCGSDGKVRIRISVKWWNILSRHYCHLPSLCMWIKNMTTVGGSWRGWWSRGGYRLNPPLQWFFFIRTFINKLPEAAYIRASPTKLPKAVSSRASPIKLLPSEPRLQDVYQNLCHQAAQSCSLWTNCFQVTVW